VMSNLGSAYQSADRLAEALPLFEHVLEFSKAKLGPEHPETLNSMNNLANAYHSAGHFGQALQLYEQKWKLMTDRFGPDHQATLSAIGFLARAHLSAKDTEKALPLYDQFVNSHRKQSQPDDPRFAQLLAGACPDLLQFRQYAAAETYLRECLLIQEKKLPGDWLLFNTKSMLGAALAGQKKFPEAEPLLVQGYDGLKECESKIPPQGKARLTEALQRLVDLYTAWDKPDEAAKWKQQLEDHQAAAANPAK